MTYNHLNHIQEVFDTFVSKNEVAGLNLLIYQNDKEIEKKEYEQYLRLKKKFETE